MRTQGLSRAALLGALLAVCGHAAAQVPPSGPPAVGVVRAKRMPITETNEFIGRSPGDQPVALVARVTAFLEQRLFTEGTRGQAGRPALPPGTRARSRPMSRPSRPRSAQASALLRNATITLNRAQALLNTPAGQRSTVDDALANAAQPTRRRCSARAGAAEASQINLDYTEIHAPIAGKISRTAVTVGNVVDPHHRHAGDHRQPGPDVCAVPGLRRAPRWTCANRYADKGGFDAVVIKLRLPDGRSTTRPASSTTSTRRRRQHRHDACCARCIANPLRAGAEARRRRATASWSTASSSPCCVEGVEPVEALGIPRAAVLSDQQGDYVYDGRRRATRWSSAASARPVHADDGGRSSAGLKEGEMVIADGIQRVRPGIVVNPARPSAPAPSRAPPVVHQ